MFHIMRLYAQKQIYIYIHCIYVTEWMNYRLVVLHVHKV